MMRMRPINPPNGFLFGVVFLLPFKWSGGLYIKPRHWMVGFEWWKGTGALIFALGPLFLAVMMSEKARVRYIGTPTPKSSEVMSLCQVQSIVRDAYREGWKVNAVSETEPDVDAEYLRGCEEVDWNESAVRALLPGMKDAGV